MIFLLFGKNKILLAISSDNGQSQVYLAFSKFDQIGAILVSDQLFQRITLYDFI